MKVFSDKLNNGNSNPMVSKIFYNKPFEYFLNRIKTNDHFRYSRFNDGELTAIINKTPNRRNCDGHSYFPQMGEELKDVLLRYRFNDNYFLESLDRWYCTLPHIKQVLHDLIEENPELKFLNTDFIRTPQEQGPEKFIGLLKVLGEKSVVVVGPSYLTNLNKHFSFRYIDVPLKNCYMSKDRITESVERIACVEDDVFFLFSASMPANIIIDGFDDNRNTYLDWGSAWDTLFVSSEFGFIKKRSSSNKTGVIEQYKQYWL